MAKRKIVWSRKADIKLFDILDFYKTRNRDTIYPQKLYHKFIKELNRLDKHPELGIKTDIELQKLFRSTPFGIAGKTRTI